MRSSPSRTAQYIALNRAIAHFSPTVPGFSDPLAADCLPARWRKRIHRGFPFWMRGTGLFNQFRTVVLDRALMAAGPLPQLVLLGAGLDTRAWRLDALRDTVAFEVDHPATQFLKRKRAAAWKPKAREVRYAAIDFQHDELAPVLKSVGFDPAKLTFWIWEGVALYLSPAKVSTNLTGFAALSAPGSRLAMTYLTKDRGRTPRNIFLALMGEPIRSAYTPTEMAATVRDAGWSVLSDTGIEDWLRDLTPELRLTRRQVGMQWLERIMVVEKSA